MTLPRIGLLGLALGLLAGCVYYPPVPPVTYAYTPCGSESLPPGSLTTPPPPPGSPPPPPPGVTPPAAAAGPQCVVQVSGYPVYPSYPSYPPYGVFWPW